jgi:hypothetical protein
MRTDFLTTIPKAKAAATLVSRYAFSGNVTVCLISVLKPGVDRLIRTNVSGENDMDVVSKNRSHFPGNENDFFFAQDFEEDRDLMPSGPQSPATTPPATAVASVNCSLHHSTNHFIDPGCRLLPVLLGMHTRRKMMVMMINLQ